MHLILRRMAFSYRPTSSYRSVIRLGPRSHARKGRDISHTPSPPHVRWTHGSQARGHRPGTEEGPRGAMRHEGPETSEETRYRAGAGTWHLAAAVSRGGAGW